MRATPSPRGAAIHHGKTAWPGRCSRDERYCVRDCEGRRREREAPASPALATHPRGAPLYSRACRAHEGRGGCRGSPARQGGRSVPGAASVAPGRRQQPRECSPAGASLPVTARWLRVRRRAARKTAPDARFRPVSRRVAGPNPAQSPAPTEFRRGWAAGRPAERPGRRFLCSRRSAERLLAPSQDTPGLARRLRPRTSTALDGRTGEHIRKPDSVSHAVAWACRGRLWALVHTLQGRVEPGLAGGARLPQCRAGMGRALQGAAWGHCCGAGGPLPDAARRPATVAFSNVHCCATAWASRSWRVAHLRCAAADPEPRGAVRARPASGHAVRPASLQRAGGWWALGRGSGAAENCARSPSKTNDGLLALALQGSG